VGSISSVAFSSDLLSGLLYIHRKSFLYCDFSPRNILLDECGILKYSDFSHASKLSEPLKVQAVDLELLELLWDNAIPAFASDIFPRMFDVQSGERLLPVYIARSE
jgi:serine/threonine protein kinase